jgi:hypothetical protein
MTAEEVETSVMLMKMGRPFMVKYPPAEVESWTHEFVEYMMRTQSATGGFRIRQLFKIEGEYVLCTATRNLADDR